MLASPLMGRSFRILGTRNDEAERAAQICDLGSRQRQALRPRQEARQGALLQEASPALRSLPANINAGLPVMILSAKALEADEAGKRFCSDCEVLSIRRVGQPLSRH